MRILLDECVPRPLKRDETQEPLGHENAKMDERYTRRSGALLRYFVQPLCHLRQRLLV